MALLLSATDVALGLAIRENTLRMVVRESSYGLGEFYSLEDDVGTIEVCNTHEEAVARIREIEEAIDG